LKRLIINADDLGADAARNIGIFEAVLSGSVKSVSILVNGFAFQHAVEKLCAPGFPSISIGVHLNISEGQPLTRGLKSITGPDGNFYGKRETHRRMLQTGDSLRSEVRREFAAQIRKVIELGIAVDHLDGHQHIHIFPATIRETIWAGEEFGIPWIRIPEEPPPPGSIGEDLAAEAGNFSRLAASARTTLSGSSLRTTDHFRGLYLKGRMSWKHLDKVLQTLPNGLAELMVHPGRMPPVQSKGPFSSFSTRDRESELEILTSAKFPSMLQKHEIQPTSFSEAHS
jgi:chitin disaccharide deacetylase